MKKLIVSLIIAGLLFGLVPQSQAINKEWSAALGFLGGVIVASSFDNHSHHRVVYYEPEYYEPIYNQPRPCREVGYWEEVTIRDWVPGYWTVYYEGPYRRQAYIQGYWTYRTEMVYHPCYRCGR